LIEHNRRSGLGRAAGNGHRVLEQLYEQPIVSVNDVKQIIGTTYEAANRLVSKLTELGILIEVTGQSRNRVFRHQTYVDLFNDPSPTDAPS
jgi:Fic family protein